MKNILAFIAFITLISNVTLSTTIYVPSQYPTIQAGINAAVNGDEVLVADGYYYESVDFLGKSISLLSENGAESTTIDPDANTWTVRMWGEEPMETLLKGFTITNSYNTLAGSSYLSGVLCNNSAVIIDNIIRNNGAVWSGPGGGIHAVDANPVIEYNQIIGNECVYYGGGIYLDNCDTAIVRYNEIVENYVYSGYGMAYGGGICIYKSNVLVERNLIVNNWADPNYSRGGAMAIRDSSAVYIYNNTFCNNQGDGICFQGDFEPGRLFFINNILVNTSGYGLINPWFIFDITIDYNDVYDNSSGGYFNCEPGEHDISADPQFVNAGSGDYRLSENSPCIDAGDPESPLDPDSTIADIGVYYFHHLVGVEELPELKTPANFALHPPYPNPFNASTAISYQLLAVSNVNLTIYDITGREVARLVDGMKPAGSHQVVFDAKDLTSGIYFIRLTAGDFTQTQKLLLLK